VLIPPSNVGILTFHVHHVRDDSTNRWPSARLAKHSSTL